MPANHEGNCSRGCTKLHALYLASGTSPNLHKQLYFLCPTSGIATWITEASGWVEVTRQPLEAIRVMGTELSNRAGA
jgi:hypothetical protein